MTSTDMLSRLRTKLDEETEDMWSDDECYRALTEGQLTIVSMLPLDMLSENVTVASLSGGSLSGDKLTIQKPSDVLRLVGAELNDIPVRLVPNDELRPRRERNSLMSATENDPTMYEVRDKTTKNTFYVFKKASTNTDPVSITYIPVFESITSTTNPVLVETTHPAIIQYAYAELLKREEDRRQEALNEFTLFLKMTEIFK